VETNKRYLNPLIQSVVLTLVFTLNALKCLAVVMLFAQFGASSFNVILSPSLNRGFGVSLPSPCPAIKSERWGCVLVSTCNLLAQSAPLLDDYGISLRATRSNLFAWPRVVRLVNSFFNVWKGTFASLFTGPGRFSFRRDARAECGGGLPHRVRSSGVSLEVYQPGNSCEVPPDGCNDDCRVAGSGGESLSM
jgi:hypothetical protein